MVRIAPLQTTTRRLTSASSHKVAASDLQGRAAARQERSRPWRQTAMPPRRPSDPVAAQLEGDVTPAPTPSAPLAPMLERFVMTTPLAAPSFAPSIPSFADVALRRPLPPLPISIFTPSPCPSSSPSQSSGLDSLVGGFPAPPRSLSPSPCPASTANVSVSGSPNWEVFDSEGEYVEECAEESDSCSPNWEVFPSDEEDEQVVESVEKDEESVELDSSDDESDRGRLIGRQYVHKPWQGRFRHEDAWGWNPNEEVFFTWDWDAVAGWPGSETERRERGCYEWDDSKEVERPDEVKLEVRSVRPIDFRKKRGPPRTPSPPPDSEDSSPFVTPDSARFTPCQFPRRLEPAEEVKLWLVPRDPLVVPVPGWVRRRTRIPRPSFPMLLSMPRRRRV